LIDCETEKALHGYYGKPSEELRISFEREVFDLANTVRARYGLKPFEWDDEIAKVARAHSEDMVLNNYFSHTNLQGESPFDRMKKSRNIVFICWRKHCNGTNGGDICP